MSYQVVKGKSMFTAVVTGYDGNPKNKPYILKEELHANVRFANEKYLVPVSIKSQYYAIDMYPYKGATHAIFTRDTGLRCGYILKNGEIRPPTDTVEKLEDLILLIKKILN